MTKREGRKLKETKKKSLKLKRFVYSSIIIIIIIILILLYCKLFVWLNDDKASVEPE